MKLPINWLKEYIDLPNDLKELISQLTSIGHMQDGPAKEIAGDLVYDLEIRQNRSDCLSIIGLAREAGAVLNKSIKMPPSLSLPTVSSNTKIKISNPDLCYRFETIRIENIKIGPSPEWIIKKLEAYGVKTINNIVDITNFVMIELGEPMHAYDTRQIDGEINIRLAKKDENITILGGKEVILTENDLVIADDKKVLSIAGVIGGEYTGISSDTASIILEDATYNQATIRRTSLRHSIRTEASTRHEKFLHPKLTTIALQRAAQLIVDIAGGNIVDHTDMYPNPVTDQTVLVSLKHLQRLSGITIDNQAVTNILKKLELPSTTISDDEIEVNVPYFRTDLEQEEDIIEEVLRIYGYDNIPDHLPMTTSPNNIESKYYSTEENIRDLMIAAGFDEQITEPLTNEINSQRQPIRLENSLNSNKTMLRTSLKENLIKVLSNQKKYRKTNIALFEIGKIYYLESENYKEIRMLGALRSGKNYSYAKMKGTIEIIFERLGKAMPQNIIISKINNDPTYFFEIEVEQLLSTDKDTKRILTSPPQIILQDLSIIVNKDVKVGDVIDQVKMCSDYVYKIKLGEEPTILHDGKKTVFLNLVFHSDARTLTNEDIEPQRNIIIKMLEEKFNAKIR